MMNFLVAQLDEIPAQSCPCGTTRRAFADTGSGAPASVHRVEISADARSHYHKTMTEIYVVIEGEGIIEADGQHIPVRPMSSVMIKPGCRHRAIGKLKILNVAIPAFDPSDEWFD
ncbi:MAG: cupin domain-containing protein [Pedosphaera sp.]|nr:cupin domain-containing protein [Pedosphaera sp.]